MLKNNQGQITGWFEAGGSIFIYLFISVKYCWKGRTRTWNGVFYHCHI